MVDGIAAGSSSGSGALCFTDCGRAKAFCAFDHSCEHASDVLEVSIQFFELLGPYVSAIQRVIQPSLSLHRFAKRLGQLARKCGRVASSSPSFWNEILCRARRTANLIGQRVSLFLGKGLRHSENLTCRFTCQFVGAQLSKRFRKFSHRFDLSGSSPSTIHYPLRFTASATSDKIVNRPPYVFCSSSALKTCSVGPKATTRMFSSSSMSKYSRALGRS